MTENTVQKDMMFEKPSTTGTIIGVFLIIASILGYVFFIKPLAEEVDTAQADIFSKQAEVQRLTTQLEILDKAEDEFQLTTEVKRLESLKAVPVSSDQDGVIKDIVEIAGANDVILNSISFSQDTGGKAETVGKLRINASFEGNYSDLVNFLEGLEQNARLFQVDSINVQLRDVVAAGLTRANFSLTFETFFQKK
ncbi:type 4a pilus biogenesis protein PilO [Candidatus Peregrinibacteria bacterium]|nr:type 4a pilus biogenesis protein PilO [Candidatus Peregrinibacteria bacterium]